MSRACTYTHYFFRRPFSVCIVRDTVRFFYGELEQAGVGGILPHEREKYAVYIIYLSIYPQQCIIKSTHLLLYTRMQDARSLPSNHIALPHYVLVVMPLAPRVKLWCRRDEYLCFPMDPPSSHPSPWSPSCGVWHFNNFFRRKTY